MHFNLPNNTTITHPALVAALAKPGTAILETLTPQKADAWHMASCVSGEAGELFDAFVPALRLTGEIDCENAIEELGDIEFYLEGLRASVGITRGDTAVAATVSNVNIFDLPARAADVFDATKKWVLYNKSLDTDLIAMAIGNLDLVLALIRTALEVTLKDTLAGNVMKLGERYSTLSYSDEQAQARADKVVH